MTDFTPVASSIGGALLGVAASWLWLQSGRVAGVSGILAGLTSAPSADRAWRWLFVAGAIGGGLVVLQLRPALFASSGRPLWITALAGLGVGFGARLGGGCTSGHGICGLSRLAPRSLAAVLVFIAAGVATVALFGRGRPGGVP